MIELNLPEFCAQACVSHKSMDTNYMYASQTARMVNTLIILCPGVLAYVVYVGMCDP